MFMAVMWLSASMSPADASTLYINRLGEKRLELAMWFVVMPIITLGLAYYIEIIREED